MVDVAALTLRANADAPGCRERLPAPQTGRRDDFLGPGRGKSVIPLFLLGPGPVSARPTAINLAALVGPADKQFRALLAPGDDEGAGTLPLEEVGLRFSHVTSYWLLTSSSTRTMPRVTSWILRAVLRDSPRFPARKREITGCGNPFLLAHSVTVKFSDLMKSRSLMNLKYPKESGFVNQKIGP